MSQPPASTAPFPLLLGKRPEDIVTLAQNALLTRLSPQELGTLLDLLDHVGVPGGVSVVRQGETGDQAYFLLEGEAHAQRGQNEPHPLGPGDHFGSVALLGLPRRSTVLALTPLRLARLSRSRFQSLSQRHPALGLKILQEVALSMADVIEAAPDRVGSRFVHQAPRRAMVQVRVDGEVRAMSACTPIRSLLPERVGGATVVAALLDSKPVSLETPLFSDANIAPLSLADWEGREVYRRSLGLVLLEAAYRIAPELRVRLGTSIGFGRVASFHEDAVSYPDFLSSLKREMHSLVRKNLPFREEVWTIEEARIKLFEQGFQDAVALLSTFREPMITLTSCGSLYALSMGPLLPTTGMIGDFSLLPHPEGLLLDFGDAIKANAPSPSSVDPIAEEQRTPRFGGDMAEAQRRWLRTQGVTSVGALTERCINGKVSELIRVSEGFHEKRIAQIADTIVDKKGKVRLIGIAGPSSSGKTTFIKRLSVHLEIEGIHPVNISLDDYYLDRDRLLADENGEYDFEALTAFDLPLLREHLLRLLQGEAVKTARFDFVNRKSHPEGGPELRLEPTDVLLIEGIHGLNPALLEGILPREEAFLVFIHPATTLRLDRLTMMASADLRLLRRIVRDRHQRNYTAADNIQRWSSVRRGEALHIYPLLPYADTIFDSSLVYEPSVLKVYAERYLLEVSPQSPAFPTAYRLRHLIDRFVAIYPNHVPQTSIAREFIGGSGFEY